MDTDLHIITKTRTYYKLFLRLIFIKKVIMWLMVSGWRAYIIVLCYAVNNCNRIY